MNFSGGKTTFFGIIFAVALAISTNPTLVGALSPETRAWVTSIAGIITAVAGSLGFASAQNTLSSKQIEEKAVKKEEEKVQLKAEIKQEAKNEAVDHIVSTVLPSMVASQAITTPTVTIDAGTVNVELSVPKAEVVKDEIGTS